MSDPQIADFFYLSGPGVVISLLILVPAIPDLGEKFIEKEKLRRIDVIGGLLSLAWPILLIFALEEGGQAYSWKSSVIIGTLVGSGVGIIIFGIYEHCVQQQAKQEPMLPIGLLKIPALCLKITLVGFSIIHLMHNQLKFCFLPGSCSRWEVASMRQ